MIDVVSAVIIRNKRLLLTQRKESQDFAFKWESPGGKVEKGETHFDALKREVGEELRADVRHIGEMIWWGEFALEKQVKVHLYPVTLAYSPTPAEGQGIGWFSAEEVKFLPMLPANNAARSILVELLSR